MTLAEVYCVPDPCATLEQRERFHHLDISRLSRPELRREWVRVRLRLVLDDAPDPWLVQRHDKLRRALGDAR